ncbi:trans-resveratrol di-O-methyltransferase-like [Punica granatum]|uniref:Uncharacterized protein n=2 Tax=Punica granatum TaxID=22663 RepID=A0A218VW81_PUNGR|nr:trans-resveratrol di-O-methyltransferase-like [Punica granatum]OWM64340.1 hypothetical protein CDL15_Pgr010131 [Punica granatum]PKI56653.1 hypothetical protein CRG98_022965 [Punica granatum]
MDSSSSNNDGAEQVMDQLLQAQAHIWKHCYRYVSSRCLKCAIELGIPDAIHSHGGPMTFNQLVEAIPVRPGKAHCLYRVMRVLVHSGFFDLRIIKTGGAHEDEESYSLNSVSELLLRDNPVNIEPFVRFMLSPNLMKPLNCMSAWFQNDDLCTVETAHGMKPWDLMVRDPKFGSLFNSAMASDSQLVARMVTDCCKWVFEGLKSLVDIGGGTGEMGKVIADAFPQMEYTVFDLPHVVASLQGTRNLKYVGGDMFNEKIPPADAILLKWILHDWNDEESVQILKKCKEAIPIKEEGGKLIIIEMVMDNPTEGDEKIKETQLSADIFMMNAMGIERNREEWAKLFADAGFSSYKMSPILGLRSVIEVYP